MFPAPDSTGFSPTDNITKRAFTLAGEMWASFLDAFVAPHLSLSQRLESLSKFAHMAFAFYRRHGSSFLSNQLYGDLQALVKSAFFCVARQQELDPTQPFYLYQIGSDRLEEIFSEVRTESHDSNCDALQLSERLSSAADTLTIFNEHPEWHQGHIRRSWSGKQADHVNPTYFTGDQSVKHVVPSNAWNSGYHAAQRFLDNHGVEFDLFDALSEEGVDFLRPNGGGVYPGVSKDKDRSMPSGSESTTTAAEDEEEDDAMDVSLVEDVPNVSLEDLLPEPEDDTPSALGPVSSSESANASVTNNDWLEYELDNGSTKQLHKASILSTLFNSEYRHLAVGRLLRVRCYTKDGGRKPNLNHQEFTGEHSFSLGDIAVALMRTDDLVSAAIIKVTVIQKDNQRLSQVDTEDLGSMESKVTITGQLLVLRDVFVLADDDCSQSTRKWLWTGTYAKFDPLKGPQSTVEGGTRKALTVKVPGAFIHPLDAEIEDATHLPLSDHEPLLAKHISHVWAIPHDDFSAIVSTMYNSLDATTILKLLPKHGKSTSFPYFDRKLESNAFIIASPTQTLAEKSTQSEKASCHQCHALIKPEDARSHVGGHIFKSINGVREADLYEKVHATNPCGFCGRGDCQVDLSGHPNSKSSTPKVSSTCPRAHTFSLGHAKKYSATTPCTNVPVWCTLCIPVPPRKSPAVYWKYSMFAHIREVHSRFWDELLNRAKDLPPQLALNLAISQEEMRALGGLFGVLDAPLAETIAPAPRRGRKRPLNEITNAPSTTPS